MNAEQSTDKILNLVCKRLENSAKDLIPWFYRSMPEYYFRTHTEEEQVRHLHALISGRVTTDRQTLTLVNPDRDRITYISPGCDSSELVAELTRHIDTDIETARIYSSLDESLRLHTFLLSPQPRVDAESAAFAAAVKTMRDEKYIKLGEESDFAHFLAGASFDYVDKFDPVRADRHFRLSKIIRCSDDITVEIDQVEEGDETRLIIGMIEPPTTGQILQASKILVREGIEIKRAYADRFDQSDCGGLAIMTFYVARGGRSIKEDSDIWKRLVPQLRLIKWIAPHDLERFADEEGWPVRRVMLLQAACEFSHQFLLKTNLYAFTSDNIVRELLTHRKLTSRLMDYFEARFSPQPKPQIVMSGRETACAEIEEDILARIELLEESVPRQIFGCILRFFKHTLRTNYYLDNIYGLSFRLDPAFLPEEEGKEKPFGFFFFLGPHCLAFHVRYREMARGGMRVVSTRTQEQFEIESNRLFDEVTALASAQHYKNKDIPEGGSKGVILLGPRGDASLAVKSVINSLLDVILTDPDAEDVYTLPGVVDHMNWHEIIYMGPDEQITSDHIMWMIERARERKYPFADAFMSSKPDAGINHKQYGVTSLGVMVFAEEILHTIGIDPRRQPFTVKITGGPKGDVASNVLRIMFRDYGKNARVVCMTDGHGAAYDPEGLDHKELMRLVEEGRSIHEFNPAKLSKAKAGGGEGAFVVSADNKEGVAIRNNLHNTAQADIFIPSGGRPDTINTKNWRLFLNEEGEPSAKAIVEGANIFITPDARQELQKLGCLIVHGSSANKTGVICSSYEILGGLVMSTGEFVKIKDRYVKEVLDILRVRARDEARLMLREYRFSDGERPLTEITMDLSREINAVSDEFYRTLLEDEPDFHKDEALQALLMSYCPPVLVEKYRDRIMDRVPLRHLYSLIAAYVASRIVYAEGVGWLRRMSAVRDIRDIVRAYLEQEKKLALYMERVAKCGLDEGEEIARILDATARKFLTSESLGLEYRGSGVKA